MPKHSELNDGVDATRAKEILRACWRAVTNDEATNVDYRSALDPTINGRQTLALSVKFITALGRSLTFQKTGENQAVVNVKATKGKSATLTLTRK